VQHEVLRRRSGAFASSARNSSEGATIPGLQRIIPLALHAALRPGNDAALGSFGRLQDLNHSINYTVEGRPIRKCNLIVWVSLPITLRVPSISVLSPIIIAENILSDLRLRLKVRRPP
jgi:hypothetical protein